MPYFSAHLDPITEVEEGIEEKMMKTASKTLLVFLKVLCFANFGNEAIAFTILWKGGNLNKDFEYLFTKKYLNVCYFQLLEMRIH